jgi:iron complex outermembrane receptor protein
VTWNATGRLSLSTSASAINARYDDPFLTCVAAPCNAANQANRVLVPSGSKLPGVPARNAYAGAKYKSEIVDVSLEGRWQSKIYVNDLNSDQASAYAIASASVAHTFQVGSTKPRVFARVDNIFDRQYVGSVIVNEGNARYFEPAPGRTFLVGIDWTL